MKPTWTRRRPVAASARTTLRASPAVVASGFSHNTGLPAARQARTCSACRSPGEAMRTAPTPASSTRSVHEACAVAPTSAAREAARSVATSKTAPTREPATWPARRRTCSLPIMPVPMTPTVRVTPVPSALVGIGEEHVAHQRVEVRRGGEELAQRAAGGAEGVEVGHGQAVGVVRPAELGDEPVEAVDDGRGDGLVDARDGVDAARVEPLLPAEGRRDDDVPADELAPVHVVAEGGGQQPGPVAALAVQAVGALEGGDAGPLEVPGV